MEHKTKYKQLTEAYLHALGIITESTATWAAFLCSAAYTYEERFQSQVLLHHQRPGVKAVATLNQWDREKNRHIIRGSHGIPVFDAKHPECLTYVFDYQDTAGRSTPGSLPWTVYENKSGIALHNLLRRSGEKSLDSYVHAKVQQIVDTEVKSETSAAMRTELQKFLEQSAKFVVCTRLGMPVDGLDTSAFSFATQYQSRPKVLERLGTLLNHSLVACLSPVRDVANAMHMTMPPPEGLAVQEKDMEASSVPEASEVTSEALPEAPNFPAPPPTVSEQNRTEKKDSRRVVKQKAEFEQLSLTSKTTEIAQPKVQDFSAEYQLLDRLRTDCEYFLGEGQRAEKHLWAGNVREQILKMRELYNALPDKPEWLTEADIDSYAKRMAAPYQVVVYHNLENGFDERREFQTLEQAEQAAQRFVNGTMEGEDGFAYDGAGVYDLANKQWLRVYGHFPDEHAMEQTRNRPAPPPTEQKYAVEIPVAGEWKKFQTVADAEQAAYE